MGSRQKDACAHECREESSDPKRPGNGGRGPFSEKGGRAGV